ncbi:MAG: threonine ammonia-lyase IlvA [Bacteroidetes bacterium]|nr:threonine ammonia-lyase IlvA [Bacteroidota bacterium]MDA0859533.1 threonine ammonia-lyase IlvA [Bacteroidota bacterium]MDA1317881.1 threonine ammonia-lyase IlvA [Bacteroidota bacterium]
MKDLQNTYFPTVKAIKSAAEKLQGIASISPLEEHQRFSDKYHCKMLFKREDLQQVRSYKIRGAYNKISSLTKEETKNGIVCASAGNHAQGVALSCQLLKIKGKIFMPAPTPNQKIEQVKMFGKEFVEVVLVGDTFDDSYHKAIKECVQYNKPLVHPFNDPKVIEGQGTVGLEIIQQSDTPIDYIFIPVGGGGLASGLSSVVKALSPDTKIIGIEPAGAPSMSKSIEKGELVQLDEIEKFVDGASVQRVGDLTFEICQQNLDVMTTVHEGKICQTILEMYNKDAIVAEPAGVMSIAALDDFKDEIKGKTVVCLVSGSNNDITRTAEIKERALLYANLKHYFIIKFPQRPGALREFVVDMLGPHDDITHFEYTKKVNRENDVAVVGIQLKTQEDLQPLITKLKAHNFFGDYLNNKPELFQFLV